MAGAILLSCARRGRIPMMFGRSFATSGAELPLPARSRACPTSPPSMAEIGYIRFRLERVGSGVPDSRMSEPPHPDCHSASKTRVNALLANPTSPLWGEVTLWHGSAQTSAKCAQAWGSIKGGHNRARRARAIPDQLPHAEEHTSELQSRE